MSRYLLTPSARRDLDGIWSYTANRWDAGQAERYIFEIRDACAALASGRSQGRSIEDVRAGYYKFAVGSHFLFYRLTSAGHVEIVRILHKRMDVPARLRD